MLCFVLVLILLILLVIFLKSKTKYWTKRGIKQSNPWFLLGDNAKNIFNKQTFVEMIQETYYLYPEDRFCGMYFFAIPTLMLRDPDLVKQIAIKDFEHFTDHRTLIPEDVDPLLGQGLFFLNGDKWKEVRKIITPCFTSSKIRGLFDLLSKSTDQFLDFLNDYQEKNSEIEFEVSEKFSRLTNDLIASTAFGFDVNSFTNPDNECFHNLKEAAGMGSFLKKLRMMGFFIVPNILRKFKVTFMEKRLSDYFTGIIKATIQDRLELKVVRPDLIQLMLEARNSSDLCTDLMITAQALIFFFAGFHNLCTILSLLSYELALQPELQERLRAEIKQAKELSYESVSNMAYLDMVVKEILRKWPINLAVDRICTKDYTIEPSNPNENPIQLKKGDVLWLPIYALHHDPKYYSDPEKFDPERFNPKNEPPKVYLPFGMGPRSCIGDRFTILIIKIVFCKLLDEFEVVPTSKTDIPLRLSNSFDLLKNGIVLGFKPLKKNE